MKASKKSDVIDPSKKPKDETILASKPKTEEK